jgi:hypothetical protein
MRKYHSIDSIGFYSEDFFNFIMQSQKQHNYENLPIIHNRYSSSIALCL